MHTMFRIAKDLYRLFFTIPVVRKVEPSVDAHKRLVWITAEDLERERDEMRRANFE